MYFHRKRKFLDIDVISGTSDGEISIWNLSNGCLMNKIPLHTEAVSALRLVPGERAVSAARDGDVCITDLTVSHEVYRKHLAEPVSCLWWDSSTLWLGDAGGSLLQWGVLTVTQKDRRIIHDGAINCIYLDERSRVLVTGGTDRDVKEWRILDSS
ncbi:Protein FAN [Eumeta japonica]|uniref:Protein FAN n=1 Tax=Eumeta variegata TaxID=151549 RepID=A0A4C1Y6B8_EUMVA|nr:Protein FAN [Eumeta japonica]